MTYSQETETHTKSSEEIRADIANKRSEMGNKLDAIQDQFRPEHIRQQAQETIRDVVDDGVQSLRDYVNDHSSEIGSSLARSVKKHPVPAALVGIGLGWLLIDSLGGDSDSDYQRNYRERQYYSGEGRPRRSAEYGYGYQEFERAQKYGLEGYPEEYVDEMNGNTSRRDVDYQAGRYGAETYEGRTTGARRTTGTYSGEASDTDHGVVENIQDAAQNAAQSVQEGAQTVANRVQNQVENIVDSAQHYSQQASRQTQRHVNQWGNEAQYRADRARYGAQRAGRQAYHSIEDNPLTFGAVALGIGVAIGLALPETRQEDRWLGDTRDRVFDAAQEAAGDVAHRAQNVAEEVRPEIEQTARRVANNLQEAGRETVEDLKQTVHESAQTVKSTAKDAAETAQREAEGAKNDVQNRAENAKDDIGNKIKPQG
jgi:ElaB/YqjD/DUF883 family membrane-anchored ribosome-binding protein